jgi:Peptidase family M28
MSRASEAPRQTPIPVLVRGLLSRWPGIVPGLSMPGASHAGPLPAFTPEEWKLAAAIKRDVEHLAGNIGQRNVWNPSLLAEAELWLGRELASLGLSIGRQAYAAHGVECANLDATIQAHPEPRHKDEIVLVGAHYDAVRGCPAANDNGTGVAATLAIARHFAGKSAGGWRPTRALRIVLFVNEEPPFFWTDLMGSVVYARACRARGEKIVAMITPETIGCYKDAPGTQHYPRLPIPGRFQIERFYPDVGNFIAFLGMSSSASLVRRCVGTFRGSTPIPSIGAALPGFVPGIGASDHWSFWREGYPAIMATDTAPFRYEHYHRASDTPDKIDYERTARVVAGLIRVVEDLVG